jgi:hypothetical protein
VGFRLRSCDKKMRFLIKAIAAANQMHHDCKTLNFSFPANFSDNWRPSDYSDYQCDDQVTTGRRLWWLHVTTWWRHGDDSCDYSWLPVVTWSDYMWQHGDDSYDYCDD